MNPSTGRPRGLTFAILKGAACVQKIRFLPVPLRQAGGRKPQPWLQDRAEAAVRARGCRIATLPMDLIGFGYAALVTFGSIFGYKRRGGVLSLIAGLFVGCLAGYGAYRVSNDKRDVKVSLCK
ncbi:hypothetical protein H8959_010192 [Pygathrix nigripes]